MKKIALSGKSGVGLFAIIDDDDFLRVSSFKWRGQPDGKKIYPARSFYIRNTEKSKRHLVVRMHRFIMNSPRGMVIDHIDGNPLNNRKSNLRICTNHDNLLNTGKYKTNTSGYKGVFLSMISASGLPRWRSRLSINKKKLNLGSFPTKELAYKAYCEACIKYHGEYHHL